MVVVHRIAAAVLLLASDEAARAFQSTTRTEVRHGSSLPRGVSVSSSSLQEDEPPLSSKYMDMLQEMTEEADRVDEEAERLVDLRQQRLRGRTAVAGSYRVELPVDKPFGITLAQVLPGRTFSSQTLDLDTMTLLSQEAVADETKEDGVDRMDRSAVLDEVEASFQGLVVKSVSQDSPAYAQGLRAGDLLISVSATLGDALWPQSSLAGVTAAISSRRMIAPAVSLEFRPLLHEEAASTASSQYELTLSRPLGFSIEESDDGYVQVSGIQPTACKMVQYAVKVGDRVLAVDSSLGDQMWPASTVEGVISAVTSRLPGQKITMRFERRDAVSSVEATQDMAPAVEQTKKRTEEAGLSTARVSVAEKSVAAGDQRQLLSRCRDVLRRYSAEKGRQSFRSLENYPALVADKVVDALATASAKLDSRTLFMIMNAYLQAGQTDTAIRIFEAATGFKGDGSSVPAKEVIAGENGGKILPNEEALTLYTGSALLKAHAMSGDTASAMRVLAALEGRSGVVDSKGLESAPWPWTGAYGSIQPDTQCFNIALSAAERDGSPEALDTAFDLFDRMSDPNEVTFNTMISAMCNARRADDAFVLFDRMKGVGLRPDKFTYTSLIKVCPTDDDAQELLYEMKERGVKADVVTYNTIIKSLCDKRQWTEATRLVTEMESSGISPDSRTYGFLMNAMLKADKPGACLTLFESACANSRTASLTENVHLYTTAITAASMLRDHERALELVSRMNACGIKPNMKTLTAVMGACLSSGKADLAAQIYRKIEKPDGYAMSQGIRALCASGELTSAADIIREQRRGRRLMSGKQMMTSYEIILHASLNRRDYDVARDMLKDLLRKGYIPSKATMRAIVGAFHLSAFAGSTVKRGDDDVEGFRYLLFVIDSLRERNLPIDSILYTAVLVLGSQLGGLPLKIASLIVQSRTKSGEVRRELFSPSSSGGQDASNGSIVDGWEQLLSGFDQLPQGVTAELLPSLPVQVASRDVGRVLRAEQSVFRRDLSRRRRVPATTQRFS